METDFHSRQSVPRAIPFCFKEAAEQIAHDKFKIREIWESRVRERVQASAEQSSLALQNTLELFLDELIARFETAGTWADHEFPMMGMAKFHGGERAHFSGYFLPHLLEEFSILRQVLTENLHSHGVLSFEVRAAVDAAIDAVISSAATEFAAVQQEGVRSALEKASLSNRDLEHVASVAAHDLKSPLATISGYLELLRDESSGQLDAESLQYIEVMKTTAERMRKLVDHLLDYARLEKKVSPFAPVDLNLVVGHVIENLNDAIERTQAKIVYGSLPTVFGDADLLTQLFQNLLANSIKFHGHQAPLIQITAGEKNGMVLFTLSDNGVGFDPQSKEEIFSLYKKLPGAASDQGTGIGLATCRKVVELHGGRIWANSKLNEGSTFCFTLPKLSRDNSSLR